MLYGKYHMGARDGRGSEKKIGRYGGYDRYGRYGGYDALRNPSHVVRLHTLRRTRLHMKEFCV